LYKDVADANPLRTPALRRLNHDRPPQESVLCATTSLTSAAPALRRDRFPVRPAHPPALRGPVHANNAPIPRNAPDPPPPGVRTPAGATAPPQARRAPWPSSHALHYRPDRPIAAGRSA